MFDASSFILTLLLQHLIPRYVPLLTSSSTLSIQFFTNAFYLTLASSSPSLPLSLSFSLSSSPLFLSPSPSPSLLLLFSSLPLYSFLRVEYTSTQTPQERASSVDLISPSAFIVAKNAPQNYQVLEIYSSLPLHFNASFCTPSIYILSNDYELTSFLGEYNYLIGVDLTVIMAKSLQLLSI